MIAGWLAASTQSAAGRVDDAAGDRDRREAELARDVGNGEDAVGGDVVGARRPGGHYALEQRLPDVVLVDELHRRLRRDRRERHGQAPEQLEQPPGERRDRTGQAVLRADGVRPEDDRWAHEIEVETGVPRRFLGEQLLELGL